MKKIAGLILVLLLSVLTVRPLLSAGYFPMHDDTQVARVVVMGRALRFGQFPVRWVSDLGYGYGYPLYNFYGPLPYYVGGTLYALGLSGLAATKIMMGFGLILAAVTMYVVVADMAGVLAGVIAGTLYVYAPYHAVQAYVRGAVGEYWALIFLPLIFWGFTKKKLLPGAVGIAGLVLSHTVLGFAGMLFTVLAVPFTGKKSVWMLLLGLGLSSFFWLPALAEMKYTGVASVIGASADFRNHFVCLGQLWNSQWGFGGSATGCLDGLSFKIGKVHLLTALAAFLGYVYLYLKYRKGNVLVVAGSAIAAVSVFFMLSVSQPVWNILPLFAYVQYPWRFLAFAVFGISLSASQIIAPFKNKVIRIALCVVCVAGVLIIEAKRFVPQYTYNRPAAAFESQQELRFRVSKISDEYLPPAVPRPEQPADVVRDTIPPSGAYSVAVQELSDTYGKFAFNALHSTTVTINRAYFPGWHYMVNTTDVIPVIKNGLPVVVIPKNESVVQSWFTNTPVRTAANIISLLSLCIGITLYDKRKKAIR